MERILADLAEVKSDVKDIKKTTGEFQMKMTEVVTRLTTTQESLAKVQADCPIHGINGKLEKARERADAAEKAAEKASSSVDRITRNVRIAVGAAIVAFVGAVLDAIGWHRG